MISFEKIMDLAPANKKNFEALKEAIRKNTLIPFTGAGMSHPYYPLWDEALKELEEQIAPERTAAAQKELASAQTEIDRCDVLERHLGKNETCRQLCCLFNRSRFNPENPDIRNQAVSLLPKLFPNTPLITTNLDRMQEETFSRSNVPFDAVLNPADEKMLEVLNQRRAHGIFYLHGCISGDLTDYDKLVFSKTQYDRHYGGNSSLVSALQRWMSGVQFLFLGCSLRNDRTLDILKKVCGKNNRLEHFAILDLKDEDKDFTTRMNQLEKDYGIRAILYPKGEHEAVSILLQRLINDLGRQAPDMDEKTKEKMQYCGAGFFLGRDSLIEEVVSEMRKQDSAILLVHGVAGIGKTEICKAAYRKMKLDDSNFEMPFIDLNGTGNLLAFCDRMAQAFRVDLKETPLEKVPEKLLSAIYSRLEGKIRWVYLDNFEDLWASLEKSAQNIFLDYLDKLTKAGLRILISSQVSLTAGKQITVKPLDKPDSEELFLKILGREVRSAEKEAFTTLLNETEGHPLSIVLVASYGRDCGSLKELLDSWHEIELHIQGEPGTHDNLTRALALAWESVKNNKAAVLRWALHVCSLLPLDSQTLCELRDLLKPSFSSSEWTEGGRLLRRLGLITTGEDETERMLLAVKKVFADFSSEKTAEAIHLWSAWTGKLLEQGDNRQSTDYYSCHNRAKQWLPQCFRLAELCLEHKYYEDLQEMMKFSENFFYLDIVSSIDLLKKLLLLTPEKFPLRAMFYKRYGDLLRHTGNLEEALAAYKEAEKLYLAEQNNSGRADVLRSIGNLLSRTGNLEEAFAAYEEAEKLYLLAANDNNFGLVHLLCSRGDLLRHIGNLKEAYEAYEEAEKLSRTKHYNLGLANVWSSKGDLLQEKKDWNGACTYYEKALELYRKEQYFRDICYILAKLQFCEKQIGKNSDAANHIQELEELLPSQPESVQEYCKRKINGDNLN